MTHYVRSNLRNLIPFLHNYHRQGGYVFIGVRLSVSLFVCSLVCLLPRLRKKTSQLIFTKFCGTVAHGHGRNL